LYQLCQPETEINFVCFVFSDLPDASAVHGILTKDGLFDGHISTPLEEYYIEPASRYFTNTKNVKKKKDSDQPQQGPLFHSVIYKASDVVHPTASPTSEDGSSEVIYTLHHTTVWSVNDVAVGDSQETGSGAVGV
jgi:hypothetical protein